MEEAQKEFNLRVTEDGMAVLLDVDIITDELDALVVALGKELKIVRDMTEWLDTLDEKGTLVGYGAAKWNNP